MRISDPSIVLGDENLDQGGYCRWMVPGWMDGWMGGPSVVALLVQTQGVLPVASTRAQCALKMSKTWVRSSAYVKQGKSRRNWRRLVKRAKRVQPDS